ncbi:non-ribosomal peptide synthetase, partial [Burkholderia gladioli]|uniref:non-ribosomal peptide synthetase n=1 Tax=Burkholderia gladioli TaxID=28095 RepID=UPI00163FFC1D
LLNLLESMRMAPGLGHDDVMLGLTSLSFDIAALELFLPLLVGARMRLASRATAGDAKALAALIEHEGITAMQATPSTWQMLLAQDWQAPPTLKLMCGGEALPDTLAARLLEQAPCIWNLYGPTETTIWSARRAITREQPAITIGAPIGNTRLYVLDAAGNPAPVGVTGELYIGGAGLARGYLNRADLSAERFVPDPFGAPGARMYRTGDLARYRRDGTLVYQGRADHQVKIRGFRIEPGEIEATLTRHPAIAAAAVIVRSEAGGEGRLVAYVVPRETDAASGSPETAALRQHLLRTLPDYMMPSHIVTLDALPLTPNGKLDRRALPAPDPVATQREYVAPRSALERALADIWAQVLGLDRVGLHDHFFDLGGHSLLATQVAARVAKTLKRDVAVRAFFDAPVLEQFAARVDASAPASGAITRAHPGRRSFPLSLVQERLWLLHETGTRDAYNMGGALRLTGPLSIPALQRAVNGLVARHDVLRSRFVFHGNATQPEQEVLDFLHVPLTRRSGAPDDVAAFLAAEVARDFDLERPPLLRVGVMALSATDHVVSVVIHHIVSDGWSMSVLVRDLKALYAAALTGGEADLAPLEIQYADYASWQRELDMAPQLAYWRAALGEQPRPPMLFDGTRERHAPRGAVASLTRDLPQPLAAGMQQLARQHGASLFMVLVAGLALLVRARTRADDMCFGTTVAGRQQVATEPLIGFFVNILPLRIAFRDDWSGAQLLAEVRRIVLGGLDHQALPYEQLLGQLFPGVDGASMLPVMLRHQNLPDVDVEQWAAGLESAPYEMALNAVAKCDLDLQYFGDERHLQVLAEFDTSRADPARVEALLVEMEAILSRLLDIPDAPISAWLTTDVAAAGTDTGTGASSPDAILPTPAAAAEAETWFVDMDTQPTPRQSGSDVPAVAAPARHGASGAAPAFTGIVELFARQVAVAPAALACREGERDIDFRTLDSLSDAIARRLLAQGVRRGTPVALVLPRGIDFLAALLGVFKTGGIQVSIDPSYPDAYLERILGEARVACLVTDRPERLAGFSGETAVLTIAEALAGAPGAADPLPRAGVGRDDIAYVAFTSGSTGVPKGVGVTYRQLLNVLSHHWRHMPVRGDDVIAQKTPSSFVVSLKEIFAGLLRGRPMVCFDTATTRDIPEFAAGLQRAGVTRLYLVPSHLRALLAHADRLQGLRQLVTAGEPLSQKLRAEVEAALPQVALYNNYGCTELNDIAYCSPGDQDSDSGWVPSGRPIDGLRLHVLDAQGQPVHDGSVGELHVEGEAVGPGYWHRPELSAERFVPNPFGSPGSRLFRTGDSACRLDDGRIEIRGRVDFDVKIRGQRVDIRQVEAVLEEHPAIERCVVKGEREGDDEVVLTAYYLCHGDLRLRDVPDSNALYDWSQARLPHHMVPGRFVMVQGFPSLPNGKLDRLSLAGADTGAGRAASARGRDDAPAGAIEPGVAAIWAAVLKREADTIGRHAHFFQIGGHSLLATLVVSRLREAFGVELPLRALFEAPVLSQLAARIDTAQRDGTRPARAAIASAPRDRMLPLSYAQQRLWFLDQLEPGDASYNVPAAVRLRGALDVAALHETLNEVVRRHEVLRTRFVARDGVPEQVIMPLREIAMPLDDLSALPPAQAADALPALLADEARTGFDLAAGPPIRARLVRIGHDDHVVSLTLHHIVSDGWSTGVLVQEVAALYPAFARGLGSPLRPLPIQYGDYACWQREWLDGAVLARQLDYWQARLADAPTLLNLPTDRSRPAVQRHLGATHRFAVTPGHTGALLALGQRHQATLFMMLASAFAVLLSRYSGDTDISIGTPIANRTQAQTEGLIGFFANTLVLREQVTPEDSFASLLARMRETTLGAYAHQDVPFEQLVEVLQPARSLAHTPLFQVMLSLQNAPLETMSLPGLELEPAGSGDVGAKFDLTLNVEEIAGGLEAAFIYDTDLFDAATIARMAAHFVRLLDALAERPDARLADLVLLAPDEREQLVVTWNDTAAPYPRELTLDRLFEAQVERTPDAVAVVDETESVSYRELNRRANRLAHQLREHGVGPDVRVGLCVGRTAGMIAALLGVLKAGGAYVPMDPAYPAERLAHMLADARPAVVLTQGAQRAWLDGLAAGAHDWQLVDLDAALADPGRADTNPDARVLPQHLAYVIYTSGSTGLPKGVAIQHSSAAAFLAWTRATFDAACLQDVLASTSICFDLSVFEIFGTLCAGCRVWLVHDVLDLMARHGELPVTLINTVPSAIAQLLRADAIPRTVATVNLAGEALSAAIVDALYAREGIESVYNLYGPTEDTTYSTFVRCAAGASHRSVIGRPVSNTQVYLLDARGNPVPIGVAGELFLGGAGLARGYLDRPALSAERFVPDPFGAPGGRMYRTGDLARYLPDGAIEYIGRADHQVKVRGFRIEPGEIEATLARHASVREAVVLARDDAGAERRLVAYVVARGEVPATDAFARELRLHLQRTLPDYMVPSHLVRLDALPLTPNGKLDRAALPAPDASRGEYAYVAPRTPAERAVAGIWADVLKLDRVGALDHFFDLGGHSLMVTQVLARVRETLGVELPVRALFEAPVLADLTMRIDDARREGGAAGLPPLVPVDRGAALPLSFAQQRLWFLDQLEPSSAFYTIPAAVRLHGALDVDALRATLDEVVRRHESLRTRFVTRDGVAVQDIAAHLDVALPLVNLSGLAEDARRLACEAELEAQAAAPFDLATGPLVRACLIRLGEADHVVSLVLHHIVSDGWSTGVLVRELAALYTAFSRNEPSPLAELPLQYADYAHWQRAWLHGEVLERQLDYW